MIEFTEKDCFESTQKPNGYDCRIDYALADKMFHSDNDTDIDCAVAIITLGIEVYLDKQGVVITSNPVWNLKHFQYIDHVYETLKQNNLCA